MQGDDGEIITPERFLPAAERYGLMPKLDSWVIETALNKLAESAAFMSRVDFVSINLSGASMSDNNILKVIESAINRSCYAPDKFCFEITETAAISNMVAAVEMANNLKALGCRLALDDFGTGLSSFSYLKSLPVDYLKVDGMFIKDIANDSFNEAMVKSINDISHVMHIRTIAEFVEDVETSDMLQMMGVDYGQGFYLGRPELLDDLIARTKTC
jgi:Amt family ammonium transporter